MNHSQRSTSALKLSLPVQPIQVHIDDFTWYITINSICLVLNHVVDSA